MDTLEYPMQMLTELTEERVNMTCHSHPQFWQSAEKLNASGRKRLFPFQSTQNIWINTKHETNAVKYSGTSSLNDKHAVFTNFSVLKSTLTSM